VPHVREANVGSSGSLAVNSAQNSESHGITNVTALKAAVQAALRGPRRNMKNSTKDKIKGSFHEVKGSIKEEIARITNDHNLKIQGKVEKKMGKIQHGIGHAEEAVAKMKGQLTELKTG
jgi:uncharacterized protein YjbJ (UPF0337 family)